MQRADAALRHEDAHFDGGRREQDDDGPAGGDPFALAVERVEDEPGLRRGLAALGQVPFRLRQDGLGRARFRLGRGDLVFPRAQPRRGQVGGRLRHALAVLVARGPRPVERLGGGRAAGDQVRLALVFLLREIQRRARLGQLRLQRFDFGGASALLRIFQRGARLGQALGGFVARVLFAGAFEGEERVAGAHLPAALHAQDFQLPGRGRGDVDVLALDVTLHAGAFRAVAGRHHGGDRERGGDAQNPPAHAAAGRHSAASRRAGTHSAAPSPETDR